MEECVVHRHREHPAPSGNAAHLRGEHGVRMRWTPLQ
jgi:hypothetical protein